MAHHKSAKKRIRQNDKRRIQNRHTRSTLRSALKNLDQIAEQRNVEEAKACLQKTIAIVDAAASKGVIHKNKASRHVSNITRKVQSLVTASADS